MNKISKEIDERRRDIATRLYEADSIKFGEFTLTSGKSSPYYVDLRLVPSYPKLFEDICDICADTLKEIGGNYKIAGVPTSGLPFATLVSQRLELPLLYVRRDQKGHGRKKGVEGKFERDYVVLIDDVSTTGGSLKEAAETVREEGGKVEHAVVILDREEEAHKNLQEMDIDLRPCFTISEIVDYLKESSILDEEKYSRVKNHLNNI